MLKSFINVFRVPELRNKILFTLLMLAIFRIGHSVPVPGLGSSSGCRTIAPRSKAVRPKLVRRRAWPRMFRSFLAAT